MRHPLSARLVYEHGHAALDGGGRKRGARLAQRLGGRLLCLMKGGLCVVCCALCVCCAVSAAMSAARAGSTAGQQGPPGWHAVPAASSKPPPRARPRLPALQRREPRARRGGLGRARARGERGHLRARIREARLGARARRAERGDLRRAARGRARASAAGQGVGSKQHVCVNGESWPHYFTGSAVHMPRLLQSIISQ